MNDVLHGFLRAPNGKITTFDAPDAGSQGGQGTGVSFPGGLNDWGAVTGAYLDQSGNLHGYVRFPEGAITEFDPPGGSRVAGQAINVFGVSVGNYNDDTTG